MTAPALTAAPATPEPGSKGLQAHCRAVVYAFFAQALVPPSPALLGSLADGSLRAMIEAALGWLPQGHRRSCAEPIHAAVAAAEQTASPGELLVEYTRLFGNGVVCPHYETEYGKADVFRAVHVLAEISAFYQAYGVCVATAAGERPDYISVELEFMNFLAAKQAWAARRGEARWVRQAREAQQRFFAEHLGRWAKPFCRNLADAAQGAFHRAIAPALTAFLAAEADHLGVVLAG